MTTDPTPAWGSPEPDDGRVTAERIHDAARAEAVVNARKVRRETTADVVAWIRRNCVVSWDEKTAARMYRELEIER